MNQDVKDIYKEYKEEMKEFLEYNEIKLTDRCKQEFQQMEKIIKEK